MVRTSPTTGYYVDVFRSNQADNDYIHHNLGNSVQLNDAAGKALAVKQADSLQPFHPAYSFFKNSGQVNVTNDFIATWSVEATTPKIKTDMWMMGQKNRTVYKVAAPPTTLLSNVTPGGVNRSPQTTPTLIVRQIANNANKSPFVAVFEAYHEGEKSIKQITSLKADGNFVALHVTSTSGSQQIICQATDNNMHEPAKGLSFKGTFGVASDGKAGFDYLYLGKGALLKKGAYAIEAVSGDVSAELRKVEGKFYYTSDKAVQLSIDGFGTKVYEPGSNVLIE